MIENNVNIYSEPTAARLGDQMTKHLRLPLYKIHTEKFLDGELLFRFDDPVPTETRLHFSFFRYTR